MYSERLMALFHTAAHGGELAGETHRGRAGTLGQGPCIQLMLRVEEGRVREARYKTYGCPAAIACAEAACAWSEGRSLTELPEVTTADVTAWVDSVPEGKEHCPALAAAALKAVVSGQWPVVSSDKDTPLTPPELTTDH
jgi:nitrogen fixation NifU-like protein